MENKDFLTPAQRKAQFIGGITGNAVSVDREGLDLFTMEERVPYLFRFESIYDYEKKNGDSGPVAKVIEVTTGQTGEMWLGKTRLKNIFGEFQSRSAEVAKGQVVLLELIDNGLEDAPVQGGKARAYKRTFYTVNESDLATT